jgi:5-methylcytosine-specific restriction endonuclease McrA
MSPRAACPTCGRGGCTRHRRRPAPTGRSYSNTAAYRAMRTLVLETYGASCVYCLAPIDLELGGRHARALVLAHVIAEADGGAFELENLRPAHRDCNNRAGRAPIPPAHG